jgi:hypothetical protein
MFYMKKLTLLLSMLFVLSNVNKAQVGQIQQIKIVSFTVKNQLPAIIDNWNSVPGALLLVAQKPPSIRVEGVRLVLQIKSGGSVVCGNNVSTGLPVDNFTTRTFSTGELTGLLSGCHDLKDGSYSMCAQFYNIDRVPISNEICKEFTVESPKEIDYAPPTLITPENGKKFTSKEMLKPVMFRWTPLVPKPKESVTYRLRVWQLMEGQNGNQAMRTNQPIVSKDVDNLNQAVVTNIYNGPCKPPYLCDFIWNVQAVNREGKPMGRNSGTSEPYTFSIMNNDIDIQIDSTFVGCCANGVQTVYIKIKNNLPTPVKITQVKIDKVNGTPVSLPVTGLSPGVPVIIAGSGSQAFTGTIKCIDSAKILRFFVAAEDPVDNAITETEVEPDTLKCKCDACEKVDIKVPAGTVTINANNTATVNQSISVTSTPAKMVKSVKAELVYFEFVPESEDCMPCNKDSKTFGNIESATLAATTGTGGGTHSLNWIFNPVKNLSTPSSASVTISLPPTVKCCDATVRFCIRWVITFEDCTVCNKLVCYEKKKTGCNGGGVNPDNK